MSATSKRRSRPYLHAGIVIALLAGSAYLTVELRKDEQAKAPAVHAITDVPALKSDAGAKSGEQRWERLHNPDRTVLRGAKGAVLASFTDGARTATSSSRSWCMAARLPSICSASMRSTCSGSRWAA